MDLYDLIVGGSGPAGEKAAALAAYFVTLDRANAGTMQVELGSQPRPSAAALRRGMSLELPGRSDLATAPWPRDIGRLSARSLACFLPCAPCPGSLQGHC
jgi:hypothetical protein